MHLIFLDTETTGLNPSKHKVLEIAFQVMEAQTGKKILGYESKVKVTPDTWAEADPKSLEINGFTWEDTLSGKPLKAVESEIVETLNHLDIHEKTALFVCQNPSFDRPFFNQIVSPEMQTDYGWPYHWLDLASMFWTYRLIQDKATPNTIAQEGVSKDCIAKHLQLKTEARPHRAMNGVEHLMACYQALFAP